MKIFNISDYNKDIENLLNILIQLNRWVKKNNQMLQQRFRKLRKQSYIRDIFQENSLSISELIYPIFLCDSNQECSDVSIFNIKSISIDNLVQEVEELCNLNIKGIMLFPKIAQHLKNSQASHAFEEENLIIKGIKLIKAKKLPIMIFADVALDPYTDHGHDGILYNNDVDNDTTVELLAKQAVLLAKAGADAICPSDMMDNRIIAINKEFEKNNLKDTLVISYAAKFASNLYNPFRQIIGSNFIGSKKTYQINFANSKEAINCVKQDISQGADAIIVKPACFYLDIINQVKNLNVPIFAYQVSGEYFMINALAQNNEHILKELILESLISIKRAGANSIITYFAKDLAKYFCKSCKGF